MQSLVKDFRRVIVGAALVVSLRAELAWEQTTIAVEAQPGQKEATAVFKFTNRGNAPVRINDVNANCGCTAAKPAKAVYAPGESGELPATMTLGGAGKSVSVQVKTDEPTGATYSLAFQVALAQPLQLTPRLLFWKIGEAPVAKRVVIKLYPGVKLLSAEIQGGAFSTKVEPAVNDEVAVWVTPEGTTAKMQASLQLRAQQPDRAVVEMKGFLRVL